MTPNEAIRSFDKTLANLDAWMEKAAEYAKARGFEVDVLATSRLAPDQVNFIQQVQFGCDQAKYAAAYLGGKPAPSHPRQRADVRRAAHADPEVPRVPGHGARERPGGSRAAQGGARLARRPLARGRRLPGARGGAEFLLPHDHGLLDPATQRRAARKGRLHRSDADARGLSRRRRSGGSPGAGRRLGGLRLSGRPPARRRSIVSAT